MTDQRIVGYLRVSTEEQKRSGLGIEAQRVRISDEADRRSWSVNWIIDDGYTGSNVARPGLTTALLALREKEATCLVVSKLDRLSRSLLDFAGLMETAKKEGWYLVALDLGIDMTSPSGALIANVMASFAEFERRLISQRTIDALAVLKERGVRLGRPRVVPPAVAASIDRWRQAGCTFAGIAEQLNGAGVETAHQGVKWYPSTVRSVLRSYETAVLA